VCPPVYTDATRVTGKRSFLTNISEPEKKAHLNQMNEERDFDNMLFELKQEAQPKQKAKEVLFGPRAKPGDDPRIRKMTVSPRNNDEGSFKAMAKAVAETDEFFKQSAELDEALDKATDAAEKVYMDDMDAEMWRVADEAEYKERHPSPSLLLSCSLPLLHPHPHPHHHAISGPRRAAQGRPQEDRER
jgi:hypothetical protein